MSTVLTNSLRSKILNALAPLAPKLYTLYLFLERRQRPLSIGGLLFFILYIYRSSKQKSEKAKKNPNRKPFWPQLKKLLPIVLPGLYSKEAFLLFVHTGFLVSRTFLSIYVAQLDGTMVKALVDRNVPAFVWNLFKWLAVGIPANYVNSMIRFVESKLSITFRTRMVTYAYKMYMTNETYYRVGNLDGRLANADQCLTEDVSNFCANLAHLHSQLSKPILDIILMSMELLRMNAAHERGSAFSSGLISIFAIWLTAKVLKVFQPPFGKLVAEEAKLAGELRFVHSRLITNSEEIAFYRGHQIESNIITKSYMSLMKHMNHIFRTRIVYNMLEGFFMKYVWSAAGLLMIAVPAFTEKKRDVTTDVLSTRTEEYVIAKKLLMSGAEAIERVMLAYKEITELAGYTSRVYEMIDVFEQVQAGIYKKATFNAEITNKRGTIIEGNTVKFDGVPIVSPNGDILIESMTFESKPGMHTLITGPNGCGKSSLFRILGGLWPVYGGTVEKPPVKDMFYIPQRPYLSIGNFRDQVIYPDTYGDMRAKGITDKDLEDILEWVALRPILDREGGWNTVNDWKDVLSGGEKQRLGMARVFYHKPKYAILDECTSAVSIDVEGKMYQHAIDIGITLLTVTHRPSLWKYHTHLLQMDGQGNWNFSTLNAEARGTLKDEKTRLEESLAGVPKMQKRLKELCALLGEDSILLEDNPTEDSAEEN